MTTTLYINESPLLVFPSLANKIGLNESIILQQMHYWLEKSTNNHDSYKWVYNSYEDWAKQFPFWSISTIRRTITKLESLGLVISGNFNKMKIDNTKWYRINYRKLEELANEAKQLAQPDNLVGPDVQPEQTPNSTWSSANDSLNTPLPESTSESTTEILEDVKKAPAENQLQSHSFFEENGFGTLGPYISETISAWSTTLSDELIIEAMKYAIERGSKTWAYVEAILRDWVDKQYTSVSDVHAARQRYKEQRSQPQGTSISKKTKPPKKQDIPEAEDLIRIGISLGKAAETIIKDVQQYHPLLEEEHIRILLNKRINLNKELEKRTKERAERFETLARKKRETRLC
ncbi:DnaD domain-containing protein [Litchfieldia salsa]|uniref:DnaD and phage-associated domain-containing protein n=1 Tax=Litchfieldia salsa TaxID=930152 RepID=A0A1H0W6Y4_9BACI|nr:DnaD domain protein [Litchfieldia salsa]SDP86241.1 DnaD and phage-associated domain-containing protein [Litchfieldia salsa]